MRSNPSGGRRHDESHFLALLHPLLAPLATAAGRRGPAPGWRATDRTSSDPSGCHVTMSRDCGALHEVVYDGKSKQLRDTHTH
jgi:hypothetical protein